MAALSHNSTLHASPGSHTAKRHSSSVHLVGFNPVSTGLLVSLQQQSSYESNVLWAITFPEIFTVLHKLSITWLALRKEQNVASTARTLQISTSTDSHAQWL